MLPNLIFFQSPSDPITSKFLQKLAPKLKSLGYNIFYDEASPSSTLESKLFECTDDVYKTRYAIQTSMDLDDAATANYDYLQTNNVEKIATLLDKNLSLQDADRMFLETLQKNNIEYKGINLESGQLLLAALLSAPLLLTENIMFDKPLAEAFRNKHSIFGRMELLHAKGVQSMILQQSSFEEAVSQFRFFYIHSNLPSDENYHLEEKIRSRDYPLPLELTIFDANQQSENEIIETIMKCITERRSSYQLNLAESFQHNGNNVRGHRLFSDNNQKNNFIYQQTYESDQTSSLNKKP